MSLIFCLTETAGHQTTNTGTTEQTRSIPTCQALLKALNIHRPVWTAEPYFLPAVRIIESKHRAEVNELLPQPVEHLHHLKNDRRRWTVIFRTNWTPFQFPPPLPYPPSVTLGCVAVCSEILLQRPMVGASPDWFFMPTEQQLILAGMQRGSSSGRQQL